MCQSFSTLPVDSDIAEIAAQLRTDYTLRTPDAIQMATAISAGASEQFTQPQHQISCNTMECNLCLVSAFRYCSCKGCHCCHN
ncbi:PIN domain-containing protein [Scytonema sp. UIC 10036]|uniref:PIN domain-containing protein n=1 Tax=Scytonema sp. UIC 10036 TaxID=2304196 RepID=UPI00325AA5CD